MSVLSLGGFWMRRDQFRTASAQQRRVLPGDPAVKRSVTDRKAFQKEPVPGVWLCVTLVNERRY